MSETTDRPWRKMAEAPKVAGYEIEVRREGEEDVFAVQWVISHWARADDGHTEPADNLSSWRHPEFVSRVVDEWEVQQPCGFPKPYRVEQIGQEVPKLSAWIAGAWRRQVISDGPFLDLLARHVKTVRGEDPPTLKDQLQDAAHLLESYGLHIEPGGRISNVGREAEIEDRFRKAFQLGVLDGFLGRISSCHYRREGYKAAYSSGLEHGRGELDLCQKVSEFTLSGGSF